MQGRSLSIHSGPSIGPLIQAWAWAKHSAAAVVMGLSWKPEFSPVLLWLALWLSCARLCVNGSELLRADGSVFNEGLGNFSVDMGAAEGFLSTTRSGESVGRGGFVADADEGSGGDNKQQLMMMMVTTARTAPAGELVLKLRVVDSLTSEPLGSASVSVFVDFAESQSSQTQEDGLVWFRIRLGPSASFVSAVVSKQRYVPALLPIATLNKPVFSSVTVSLLALNRGNMWLYNDSVIVSTKSTGVVGSPPLVQFPRSALSLTDDNALSAVTAFMNSPSLSPAEGALLHTVGILSTNSGPSPVDLSPVASAFVQLLSSSSSSSSSSSEDLDVVGPISLSLSVSDSCGLQDGDHVPAWTFNHTHGAWVRRGLGTVQSLEDRLVWTFAAPHLGHWMAAPLSPSRGIRLDQHVDFLLRHGSFLMILLGSTLSVAVALLIGLLCCPRSPSKESKLRRPAVNPLLSLRDQSTSTRDDHAALGSSGQYHLTLYESGGVVSNPGADHQLLLQTKDQTADPPQPEIQQQQQFGNGFFFYNQPVAILHAPAFFQVDESGEQQWSKSTSLPDDVTQTKITNQEPVKADVGKKTDPAKSRAASAFPESVSEPGTLGNPSGLSIAQGPRAWFVSLEGKPAAEIRYAVNEEQQRRSRDTSLDSGLDLSEPGQAKRDSAKLERNATFVKKSSKLSDNDGP